MDKEQGNKDNYQTRRFHELNASLSGNINIDASDLTEYRELLEILLRSRSITWEEIPSEVIIKHSEIRREAIRQKEWHKVVLALNVAANAVDVQSMLSDLTEFYKQYLWSDVTEDALRRHISLWQLEKPERQVRCLVTGNTPATSDELDRVGKVLSKATEHERRYFIEIIPDNQLGHPAIFSHLSPEEQVRCCWERLLTQDDEWVKLSSRAKILAIYRGLYEGVQLLAPLKYFKGDSIALYVHKIYSLRDKADDVKVVGFRDAHQRLQDYVIDTVFESDDPLCLDTILPPCTVSEVKVTYCEGRPHRAKGFKMPRDVFATSPVSKAYCPRGRRGCSTVDNQGNALNQNEKYKEYRGARLYSIHDLHWSQWSVNELLSAAGVVPRLDEKMRHECYGTAMSGWVNRINEIRERMKCSICNDVMMSDTRYASRELAVYGSTIMYCRKRQSHDKGVYLSHCWACRAIVDSRECKVQVSGLYLCIECGSGPMRHLTYSQGDKCPKCGSENMSSEDAHSEFMDGNYSGTRECYDCTYRIKLPPQHMMTGSSKGKQRVSDEVYPLGTNSVQSDFF